MISSECDLDSSKPILLGSTQMQLHILKSVFYLNTRSTQQFTMHHATSAIQVDLILEDLSDNQKYTPIIFYFILTKSLLICSQFGKKQHLDKNQS